MGPGEAGEIEGVQAVGEQVRLRLVCVGKPRYKDGEEIE